MQFKGRVTSSEASHQAEVVVGDRHTTIQIAARESGRGSSVSGGELLMLALATCYCNDVYREAARMGLEVTAVDVECTAEFAAEGAPGGDIAYTARISAKATEEEIRELAAKADALAEIQNTVRNAIPVRLSAVEAIRH